jgi:type II secretory pathway component PulM
MSALSGWWDRRNASEQRTLRLGAALLILAALALAALEIERTRARLEAELPRLRASIAGLQRDAAEVKRLGSITPVAAQQPSAAAPLATLATNGGGLAGAQIAIVDERHVKLSSADVGFGALLEWLQNAQATHGMRVESARLEALPATGRVRAELLLTRS